MYRPVLVQAPGDLPISVEEVKQALRIGELDDEGNPLPGDDDAMIERDIRAAVAHYEGWTGILGICLVEQMWRQDFDRFGGCMRLPLRPVRSIASVKWRNRQGQIATVDQAEYALETDGGGWSFVRFRNAYRHPSDLYETAAVQVEYRVGWPLDGTPPKPTVPKDILTAIIARVQMAYDEAAKSGAEHLARMENALISKYRPFRI